MDGFNDDFEFVDNGFDDDGTLINEDDDEMLQLSNMNQTQQKLNKSLNEVNELKKHLKSQTIESNKLFQKFKEQSNEYNALNDKLRKELKDVSNLKDSLKKSQSEFDQKCNALNALFSANVVKTMPSNMDESKKLLAELKAFSSEQSNVKAELDHLKNLRKQQQDMIVQCKIHIEQINSNQRDCLISLEKSKSFSCKECGTDIGLNGDIESKCYQVGQGQFSEKKRGYLFKNAVNMTLGKSKTENFTTGAYEISWTSCAKCKTQMGWKYVSADNPSNTSKVGKYCLSRYALHSPEDRAQTKK